MFGLKAPPPPRLSSSSELAAQPRRSRGMSGDCCFQLSAMAEAGLTPAVQNSVDQVICDGVILGDMLMALFAFPCVLKNPCCFLEYSGHFIFDGNFVTTPFK